MGKPPSLPVRFWEFSLYISPTTNEWTPEYATHQIQVPGKCTPVGTQSAMIDSRITSCTHKSKGFSFTRDTLQPGPCGHTTVPLRLEHATGYAGKMQHQFQVHWFVACWVSHATSKFTQQLGGFLYATLKKPDVLFPPMQFPPLRVGW